MRKKLDFWELKKLFDETFFLPTTPEVIVRKLNK